MGQRNLFHDATAPKSDEKSPWAAFGLGAPYTPDTELADKQAAAQATLKDLIRGGHHLMLSCSWGKDSSVMLSLALEALRQVVAEDGTAPHLYVVTSNTLVENPLLDSYYRGEARKVEAYAKAHGLPVTVATASPSLSQNYLVNLIGGRAIASMPGQDSACSSELKVAPLQRLKRRLVREAQHTGPVVSLIGKRWSESADRQRTMIEAGERPDRLVERNGELQGFPIAAWSEDDVFEYIGLVRSGLIETYSDFDALVETYRGAAGGECMVTAFADGKAARTGCSARFGCHLCLRVADDRSMENLVEQHDWLRPLNDFRNFVGSQHFNPAKRNYLPRSVSEDGTVALAPGTYSPDHCEDLLRYALTIQIREEEAAAAEGRGPRFSLIGPRELLAIETLWQRYGYHSALKATAIWRSIYLDGERFDVPNVSRSDWHDRSELPRHSITVPLPVGQSMFDGFRDLDAATAGCESATVAREGVEFDVDFVGACQFLEWESGDAVAMYAEGAAPAAGLFHLLRLGVVSLRRGSASSYERMLRIGNAIHTLGLRDCLDDPEELARRLGGEWQGESIPQGDLLAEAL